MITLFAFLVSIAFLILVHEFGHFLVARRYGLKVEEFGIGFPPRLFGVQKGETLWSVNAIPLGGFVRILGEGEEIDDLRSFSTQSVSVRSAVVIAGIVMNLFLAYLLFAGGYLVGIPDAVTQENRSYAQRIGVAIVSVRPDSPAEKAGIRVGDQVMLVRHGQEEFSILNPKDLSDLGKKLAGEEISLTIARGSQQFSLTVVPRVAPPQGEGPIGVAIAVSGIIRYPFPVNFIEAFKRMWDTAVLFVSMVGQFLKGLVVPSAQRVSLEVAGPLGIYNFFHQFQELGFGYVIVFIALISINLALINVLPFPALDGGRLLFLVWEGVTRRRLQSKVEVLIHQVGFVILIFVLVLVTLKDLRGLL